MIDTEHVKCDTCTAPEPMELDASDEASRGWPTVDIETNPYKGQFPLFQQHPEIAFLDSAATALAVRRGHRCHREGASADR
mgnify:CR=1 FL=1